MESQEHRMNEVDTAGLHAQNISDIDSGGDGDEVTQPRSPDAPLPVNAFIEHFPFAGLDLDEEYYALPSNKGYQINTIAKIFLLIFPKLCDTNHSNGIKIHTIRLYSMGKQFWSDKLIRSIAPPTAPSIKVKQIRKSSKAIRSKIKYFIAFGTINLLFEKRIVGEKRRVQCSINLYEL